AYDRLAGSLDSQRQFIADASHELRTPLTSIRTNAAVLERDDLAPGDRLDAAADITAEAARMSRLVEDLLTLARADAGIKLELAVSDDGDGIPASDLERIFKRFYQADPSRYRSGAGLGLSIARWIATEHGGAISAANRPAGGARFEVLIPAAP